MGQQSATKRTGTKLWQFSIAQLLGVIYLVAVTCGAFRFSIIAGVWAVHFSVAIVVAFVRTRAAIRHQEELWIALELPDSIRSNETAWLAITSIVIAVIALFSFYLGIGIALLFIAVIFEITFAFLPWMYLNSDVLAPLLAVSGLIAVLGVGLLFVGGWLKMTWPKSYFMRTAPISSPSDKNA